MKIHQIKLNGLIELENAINKDKEYSLLLNRVQQLEGKQNTRIDKMDREIITYTMVNLGNVAVVDGKEVITGKAKNISYARELRMALMDEWEAQMSGAMEFEEYYQKRMKEIISNINIK